VFGIGAFSKIAELPGAPFAVPLLYAQNALNGWLITEWVSGKQLADGDYDDPGQRKSKGSLLDIYTFLDNRLTPRNSRASIGSVSSGQAARGVLEQKLNKVPKAAALVGNRLLAASLNYIEQNFTALTPAFTHGDLTPKQIIRRGGKTYIIDYESASFYWPRFYELVNYTSKIAIVHSLGRLADEFTVEFFGRIGEDPKSPDTELRVLNVIRALLVTHELAWHQTNRRIYGTALEPKHLEAIISILKRHLPD